MLEKPAIDDDGLIAEVRRAYGVPAAQLEFLPLGADPATAVYRMGTANGASYFLKLRRGSFDINSVALPRFLRDQGIEQIIAPLRTQDGTLYARFAPYTLTLYPFVEGHSGYDLRLTDRHWYEFGQALRRVHSLALPPDLGARIRRETFSPQWRDSVDLLLSRVARGDVPGPDPVGLRAAEFLMGHREVIHDLVRRARLLAQVMTNRSPEFVLCHSDIHAGNLLVDAAGALYIIDWDDPVYAPRERDLMFIGGAQGFLGYEPEEEAALFYRGYGDGGVDPVALAYYRYERIVVDIALFSQQLLLSDEGGEDRAQALTYLACNFEPGGTIETAYKSDRTFLAAR